ncbi:MAG TPA: protoporphyrinogen oxidase [Terriglobia bacterium]|nr:protoporphyrinogen oxidase [Terriglobia bacterium]
MERRPWRIAVLGGGISGLTAAYTLARARESGAPIEEFLIEASDRLGGLIQTERAEGFVIEAGPDSFLAEKPEAAALCRELGLGDSLIGSNDAGRRTYILHRGRLVPLPDGLMLMVPTRLWPVLATPLLGWTSKLAIVTEPLRAARGHRANGPTNGPAASDESVSSFVRRHFGRGMVENIADPLLAGVFGGDSERLSARSALPRFWEMEREHGSLTRAVLEARRRRTAQANAASAEPAPPLFMTLREGLGAIVDALRPRLESSRLCLERRVLVLERRRAEPTGYIIRCEGGGAYEADALVLALPAHECARLISPLDSALGVQLGAIPYTGALTVALAYGPGVREALPGGFGFLVPRKEGKRMLACTFVHAKFDHRAPNSHALLRCFLGGARDPDTLRRSDNEIVSTVRRELRAILGLDAEPLFHRIYRWPSAMPQYEVGHAERVSQIEHRLDSNPGLFLAGNTYSGIGISDCIRTGRTAATKAVGLATEAQRHGAAKQESSSPS